jgi:hypothetical protein
MNRDFTVAGVWVIKQRQMCELPATSGTKYSLRTEQFPKIFYGIRWRAAVDDRVATGA